jgi:hypothetical protein
MMDIEVYKDYFLVKLDNPIQDIEMFPGQPMDIAELHAAMSSDLIVTFNGNHFDMPLIAAALAGANNAQLKQACDEIIGMNLQPWEFYSRWNLETPDFDHIDMIEIAPGRTSLKEYGGKMHSRKLQDLPIDPSESITPDMRGALREYCGNDLATTRDLFNTFPSQIALRVQMSAEYDMDLRSKSDPQIAESIMKKLTGVKNRQVVSPGTAFYYRPPAWLAFQNLNILDLLSRSVFKTTFAGGVDMPVELGGHQIRIGRSVYRMGIGGLHSSEQNQVHLADDTFVLQDVDVASYYPTLILKTGIVPPAIGAQFVSIYQSVYTRRLAAKAAGNKKDADSLKTFLNGVFGKLLSKWSIFYDPTGGIQVTVTGQLALLMLIEMLEISGIGVVSANTDGIVIKCRKDMTWLRDQVVAWWCKLTGFETEAADYAWIASRDVNNYVAMKTDGTIKLKGAYARPVPVATSWPNPSGEVCIDAVVAYMKAGTPVMTTIKACQDVRKFVHIRKVKGGGEWCGQLLGRAVRWYYATSGAPILYRTNGNKVAASDGCRPLMELPEGFAVPDDIDYSRYAADAVGMIRDLGVVV